MGKPFVVGGQSLTSDEIQPIVFPYDGQVVEQVCMAKEPHMEQAVVMALRGFETTRRLPTYKRIEILDKLRQLLQERFNQIVQLMILESGKTYKTAHAETMRAIQTTRIAAEEVGRIEGEVIDLAWTPAGAGHCGFVRRFPVGVILGITPFNYPLNLALHKLAPAIASGNAIIIKPPEVAPLSSLLLAELVLEAGFPPEAFSLLPAPGPRAEKLVIDDRIAMVSFTGSAAVGWAIKNKSGRKRVTLELGGNAPVIVHYDADLDLAIQKTVAGSFTNAGQNCIAVQRILVHSKIYDEFCERFVAATKQLKVGDPRDPETDIGPMINDTAAKRAFAWVQEAIAQGAVPLLLGDLEGALYGPTVLTNVQPQMKVCAQEIFAPVVTIVSYETWDEAIDIANDSEYGLQGGIFTHDIRLIMDAWERLEVGGLQINDVSTFRVDHMPYGGVKASGFGREGVRYAIQEMTELRQLVINI
ncbi:MAG: aldehyde dehydrogenase [Phototrophicales bacterium]|nr:MAG: aldehyde dehydrogenase [Phototrophicales bacterium]